LFQVWEVSGLGSFRFGKFQVWEVSGLGSFRFGKFATRVPVPVRGESRRVVGSVSNHELPRDS
jgi:hypothetical protein